MDRHTVAFWASRFELRTGTGPNSHAQYLVVTMHQWYMNVYLLLYQVREDVDAGARFPEWAKRSRETSKLT